MKKEKKITIHIEEDLMKELKIYCAYHSLRIKELIATLIKKEIR